MRYRLRDFFARRYGLDALGYTLLGTAAALIALSLWSELVLLNLLGCIVLVWEGGRALSGDLNRRWAENRRFTGVFCALRRRLGARRALRQQESAYKFFRCPGCGQRLRVPRGKGRLQITCPRCGHRFEGKT